MTIKKFLIKCPKCGEKILKNRDSILEHYFNKHTDYLRRLSEIDPDYTKRDNFACDNLAAKCWAEAFRLAVEDGLVHDGTS